jgi:hypothetical protein
MQIFKDQSGVFKERQSNNAVPLATRTLRPDLHHVKAEHMEKHLQKLSDKQSKMRKSRDKLNTLDKYESRLYD